MISIKRGGGGPVEVRLTRRRIGIDCTVIREDGPAQEYEVDSPSMRGAQRETTSWLTKEGYTPLGRWETAAEADGSAVETVRRFRPA